VEVGRETGREMERDEAEREREKITNYQRKDL
jgi:hypothetical protein